VHKRKNLAIASLIFVLTIIVMLCFDAPFCALAQIDYDNSKSVWNNSDSGYAIFIDDWANLLTAEEEDKLLETLKEISAYGNVAFVSISDNPAYDTEDYIKDYYTQHFGNSSGTVFLIDMDYRNIWIHSNGNIYKTITKAYADTITDNVYTYASEEDYNKCTSLAFEQILTLLQGRRIAQPMKYISNALLAITIALLINYFLVMLLSRSRKATTNQLLDGIYSKVEIHNPSVRFLHQTKRYDPPSSSSSGGSRSGGGGGGGGGGGHSF